MDPITIALKFEGNLPGEGFATALIQHFDKAPPEVQAKLWQFYLEDVETLRAIIAPLRVLTVELLTAVATQLAVQIRKQLEAPNGTH